MDKNRPVGFTDDTEIVYVQESYALGFWAAFLALAPLWMPVLYSFVYHTVTSLI